MKRKMTSNCMSVIVLVALIGTVACDNNTLSSQDDMTDITDTGPLDASVIDPSMEILSGSGSSSFTLEINANGSQIHRKAKNLNQQRKDRLLFNVASANPMQVTGRLKVTKGQANGTSNKQRTSPIDRAYKGVPSDISYDKGTATIRYTIDGTSLSANINTRQKTILNNLQKELDRARSYRNSPGSPNPCDGPKRIARPCQKFTSKGITMESLKAMDDQQIKKWLQENGYEVKELGNRLFAITKQYSESEFSKGMAITSVFNAKTGKMKPEYSVSKDGETLSRHSLN